MITKPQHSGLRSNSFSEFDPEAVRLRRYSLIAKPGFNRWMVPPAALAIHLCIGMAYGFSVFWKPLTELLSNPLANSCPNMTLLRMLYTLRCNWREEDVTLVYTLFFVFLGCASATAGTWLERIGPRRAGILAAIFWSGGLMVAAAGIKIHQLWVVCLGAGMIGGIGLGIGYISPISTLLAWFPDKRGVAAGMAIMGFGGGALVGSPLAQLLMTNILGTGANPAVWQSFFILGLIYLVFMLGGSFAYRLPPPGWRPPGWTPKTGGTMMAHRPVHIKKAHRTPQFWLIWMVLAMNVSAGIGILGSASSMLQEIFGGRLIDLAAIKFAELTAEQRIQTAVVGAGFVGLLSLFNIGGRFFWSSVSDRIGRKKTYSLYFILGFGIYFIMPTLIHHQMVGLFVISFCIAVSIFGAGFATIPAYLADIFGTQFVGAILGRILTAWSVAGILGPVIVNYFHSQAKNSGLAPQNYYDMTLYILSGLLILGFVANMLIRPVNAKWHMTDREIMQANVTFERGKKTSGDGSNGGIGLGSLASPMVWLAWSPVAIPLLWGVWMAFDKARVFIPGLH
ncbi:MAG: OFA family MFS transporter [Candidatus Pacebacteria bacterium]|nr:OFA family MFS transporter [Candidatus Paceibacterota bacterium]